MAKHGKLRICGFELSIFKTRPTPWLRSLAVIAVGFCLWSDPIPARGATVDIRRDAVVEAVERVNPSVVNIGTVTLIERRDPTDELLRQFYGPSYRRRKPQEAYSLGSGVIIDESGYVLTNDHVVRQASRIRVKLIDGREFDAERVASVGTSDVAVLKLVATGDQKFTAVKFAKDDDLLLGETVIALGNPFGLGGSISRGILSSKVRRSPRENEPLHIADWLQTDAAINFGNSGGPLVNVRGELIGLNVAIYEEGHGIGFAIPMKRVNEALTEIFTPEGAKSIWFGARMKPGPHALVASQVDPDSPAAKAGLQPGDLVVQIDGKTASDLIAFNRELIAAEDKRNVALVVQRGNERKNLTLRQVPESTFFNAELIRRKIGASWQPLTPELAERLGLNSDAGFVIAGVDKNSPAAEAGLERGVVVQAIDGKVLEEITAAAKIFHGKKKGDKVVLSILVQRQIGNLINRRTGDVEISVR